MKTTITPAERLRIAEWLIDVWQLREELEKGIAHIERQIARTLGLDPDREHDSIIDAIHVPRTVDELLLELQIDVEEEV